MKEKLRTLAQLATPTTGRPGVGRLLLAGGSALALVGAGALAIAAFAVLLGALLSIYLITTRILGIKLELDPKTFYERFAARPWA